MNFKPRLGALPGFILCGAILIFEWALRTRAGTVHPMALLIFSAGVTLTLAGLISPAITQPTAQGKLSPLAHKIGLVGFAIGGAMIYWLR